MFSKRNLTLLVIAFMTIFGSLISAVSAMAQDIEPVQTIVEGGFTITTNNPLANLVIHAVQNVSVSISEGGTKLFLTIVPNEDGGCDFVWKYEQDPHVSIERNGQEEVNDFFYAWSGGGTIPTNDRNNQVHVEVEWHGGPREGNIWTVDGNFRCENESCEPPPPCEWNVGLPMNHPDCIPPQPPAEEEDDNEWLWPSGNNGLDCLTTTHPFAPGTQLYGVWFEEDQTTFAGEFVGNAWVDADGKLLVWPEDGTLKKGYLWLTNGSESAVFYVDDDDMALHFDLNNHGCIYIQPKAEESKEGPCIDCPPAQCLLQPEAFVYVHSHFVGLTENGPQVYATRDAAEDAGLTYNGDECSLCAINTIDAINHEVFITNGSTAFDIAVAINQAEGSLAPHYLDRHLAAAQLALANWRNAEKADGWYSYVPVDTAQ